SFSTSAIPLEIVGDRPIWGAVYRSGYVFNSAKSLILGVFPMQDQDNKEVIDQQSSEAPGADAVAGADTQAEAPAAPASEPSLEEQLSATEAKLAEMHDAFMRAKAEADNIRRRAQEDVSKAHKFAIESFAEAMVPVRDSLEMAIKVEAPTVESIKEGVEMTLKQ